MILNNNLLCGIVTVSFLVFLTNSVTDGYSIQIFGDKTKNFDRISTSMPNYTDYVDKNEYKAQSVIFNPKGMEGYYRLTKSVMDGILEPNFLKEDMIVWDNDNNPQLNENVTVNSALKQFSTLGFILILLALITILVPITGLIFGCCRCAGSCGAKAQPGDVKRDYCMKVFQGAIILCLSSLLMMGVICTFATNEQMNDGTQKFPESNRIVFQDTFAYLDSTTDQAKNLLVINYNQFTEAFRSSMQNTSENILNQLDVWIQAGSFYNIYYFVTNLTEIKTQASTLQQSVDELKNTITDANNKLTELKTKTSNTLSSCPELVVSSCNSMNTQIAALHITIDFSMLPDLTTELNKIDADGSLTKAVDDGKSAMESVEINLNSTVTGTIEQITTEMNTAGEQINKTLDSITKVVQDLTDQIKDANGTIEDYYNYFTTYSSYFYYGGLVVSCFLLIVLVCILFGLIWGVFSRRPEAGKSNSCTKQTGSSFLFSAAIIIFSITLILGLLTVVMLIFGLLVDRGICYPLRNPHQSTMITILDSIIQKGNPSDLNLNITNVLEKCGQNESIFNVFGLDTQFNIKELIEKLNVTQTLDEIISNVNSSINSIMSNQFKILDDTNFNALKTLEEINLNVNYEAYETELNKPNLPLDPLIDQLQNLKNMAQDPFTADIDTIINDFKNFNDTTLQPLISQAHETLNLAKKLDVSLKMNASSFSEAITNFLNDVMDAQTNLANNNSDITEAAQYFVYTVRDLVVGFLDRVVYVAESELGRCGSLSGAINATLVSTCDNIILPWNGFWVSLFITLLVYMPTLVLTITLSSLYKKYKGQKIHRGKGLMVNDKSKNGKQRYSSESRYDDMAPRYNRASHTTATRF